MRYKNHEMIAVYLPGADFNVKNGMIINRKTTKNNMHYVETIDDEGYKLANCKDFKEARRQIDEMVAKYGK